MSHKYEITASNISANKLLAILQDTKMQFADIQWHVGEVLNPSLHTVHLSATDPDVVSVRHAFSAAAQKNGAKPDCLMINPWKA